jgi:hypothetical protein
LFVAQSGKWSQIVEIYYDGGQWGIRKISNASQFEDVAFWRQFLSDGYNGANTQSPSQMGNELQIAATADNSKLLVKFLEAKNITVKVGGQDSVLGTTDVVVAMRDVGSGSWSLVKNATQSNIIDRITWIPKTLPNNLTDIPLITVQAKDQGTNDAERFYWNQLRLATAQSSEYEDFKQYVTASNFTFANLPNWDGITSPVEDDFTEGLSVQAAPNPVSEVVSIAINESL